MYALFLRDHQVLARIGIHAFERAAPQRLILNVCLAIRGEAAADDIAETTDYDFLRAAAAEIVASGHLDLQETVCRRTWPRPSFPRKSPTSIPTPPPWAAACCGGRKTPIRRSWPCCSAALARRGPDSHFGANCRV